MVLRLNAVIALSQIVARNRVREVVRKISLQLTFLPISFSVYLDCRDV